MLSRNWAASRWPIGRYSERHPRQRCGARPKTRKKFPVRPGGFLNLHSQHRFPKAKPRIGGILPGEGRRTMRFGIGQPVTRKEDPRFLTGRGRYVADIDLVRQAHAVFVYSPHAHARIRGVDKTAAEQVPGVFAVLTGEEWAADGFGTLDPEAMAEDMGGPKGHRTQRPPLAIGRVRHVGERVAVVIAATEALARDAAELIAMDYEVLPAIV